MSNDYAPYNFQQAFVAIDNRCLSGEFYVFGKSVHIYIYMSEIGLEFDEKKKKTN